MRSHRTHTAISNREAGTARRTIYQTQQKNNMQTQLMTGNEQIWRTVFNKTIPISSWIKIEAPKMVCSDTTCSGIIQMYNVDDIQVYSIAIDVGASGNIFFWMPKFNGPYVDNNNKTHDLSICEDTLEGKICRLHSAVYEPCVLQNSINICEFTILPISYKMLVEIAPQEVCVVTNEAIIPKMTVPF
ncbi:unnamed protein product, partial [Ranitomeya imitator]